jgi:hypothetical protein
MPLIEKLEKWAKELDRERWLDDEYDFVELSDLLSEAAKRIRAFDMPFIATGKEFHGWGYSEQNPGYVVMVERDQSS